jgi:subfamily B ATP-binding cassette protein MsbA
MAGRAQSKIMSKRPDWHLFKWLWRNYLRRFTPAMILALILMSLEGSMMGALSYMLKPMFDNVFVAGNPGAIWWVGGMIFGIFMVRAVTSVTQKVLMTWVSQRTAAMLQSDLLRHLMRLDSSFHQKNAPGYLMARMQNDVMGINSVWSAIITGAGRDVIALISLFVVALMVDWRWTLVALLGTPLMIAPTAIAQRFVRRYATRIMEVAGHLSTRLDEVFHGITAVKLNRLERYQQTAYDRYMRRRVRDEVKTSFWRAMIPGLLDVATGIGFLGVLIYGGRDIIDGQKTVGEFMSFFTAMGLAFEPLRRLGNISGLWQQAAASIERLMDLFETQPTITSPATPALLPKSQSTITFDNVHLSYGDQPVLNGLSFTAEAGKTTALVGASGAGKSTVFNLLTRLVDPSSGEITLGGVALSSLDLADLRGLYSVVSQDAALFDETLRENIVLGQNVPDPALQRALKAAHVTDFLPQLAKGLESPVGPRGSNLSGGQRQRVAIARAILRDTPILLLDEATSALDTKSEAIVQNALDTLSHGRTTLVIAHRLSTIQGADKIVVMDHGRVLEEGTHADLLRGEGAYAALHALQFKD